MAQTGEVKYVVTAGIPSIEETGEVKYQVTAGIPSAWTEEVVGGQLLMHPGMDGLGNYQFDNAMSGGING